MHSLGINGEGVSSGQLANPGPRGQNGCVNECGCVVSGNNSYTAR